MGEDTSEGKKNASCALHQLLKHFFSVGDVLIGNAQCCFAIFALVDSLNSMDLDGTDVADALEVVSLLARMKQSVNFTYSLWYALVEAPQAWSHLCAAWLRDLLLCKIRQSKFYLSFVGIICTGSL